MTVRITDGGRAVIEVARVLAKYGPAPRPRLRPWRRPTPMDCIPLAREVVASLFLLPEGRAITAAAFDELAPEAATLANLETRR